jgi:hypothetical protein
MLLELNISNTKRWVGLTERFIEYGEKGTNA